MKALGVREYLGTKDVGQKFPVSVFGPTTWTTYKELSTNYHAFGAYLRYIGNKPQIHTKDFDNDLLGEYSIVIFEDTCDMWITAALGAWTQDMLVTTVYGTLGPDAVVQAVQEGQRTTLLCNRKNVHKIIARRSEMPSLKYIIYTDLNVDPKEAQQEVLSAEQEEEEEEGIKVIPYPKALSIGKECVDNSDIKEEATADSVAVIMYTSGTTGKPKGVVMPHSSVLFTIGSVIPICIAAMPPHFSHVAYLPLSHIFELAIHIGVLSLGGNIGYADPRTLSNTGARPTGALQEFKPHLIMGVPKVYEVIMKGAKAEIAKLPAAKQQLVNAAFEWKLSALNAGRYTPIFDKLIFKKIEDMIGGRVNGILSGGGPLASHIQDWIRTAFGCYVVQVMLSLRHVLEHPSHYLVILVYSMLDHLYLVLRLC
ncbi:Long-chain-fatty-acid--CoA ligase, putative [Perkinsus marinus ATCC 50983]|uniref:Long-chain-fatty-acid--CoA ligase, putative n=1 Tax=Perkinsus marinus (strain ATCC 50983 / TXsc) TaxID=423536 RepID=C5LRG4_PERM5|nr:Long-chain-fatty-acid--CoA ligase, putative [Perkinsus marinus ATCC 50983]EER00679.1 Long-chain-fatty-acid--CoA ligase, putative [Perkinsus marinus ATCC 50983]|eukprot:XP_002767961.1 Long-chain-fatty-acid--CoA ligase, putative [Perkinsus marinus ATCC 50983]